MQRAKESLELAEYTVQQLRGIGIPAWRNKHAITVVFPKLSEAICRKWQLASDYDLSHLICMPGVTKQQIDDFVVDCKMQKESPVNCEIEPIAGRLN